MRSRKAVNIARLDMADSQNQMSRASGYWATFTAENGSDAYRLT
jgi:hypothetical protein